MQVRTARLAFSRQLTRAAVRSNRAKCLSIPKYYIARHQHNNTNSVINIVTNNKPISAPVPAIKQRDFAASARRHYHSGRQGDGQQRGSIVLGHHVRQALANGCPVVALESTVITHGLPEPNNLELALRLEDEIVSGRWWLSDDNTTDDDDDESASSSLSTPTHKINTGGDRGGAKTTDAAAASRMRGQVTPATVGIVRGQLIVGLSRDEIEYLAHTQSSRPIKASRRDIPLAQALGLSAGTTVSATMAIATSVSNNSATSSASGSSSKIAVFATGGLGGVHLGGERSMDISADLYEMARSPMGVVSSGFKSFLDSRRSLEFLETMGCTVTSLRGSDSLYQAAAAELSPTRYDEDDGRNVNSFNNTHLSTAERTTRSSIIDEKRSQLFPGFFTCANKEQVKSPWQCESVEEAAKILFYCLGQGTEGGAKDSNSSPPSNGGPTLNHQLAAPSFGLQNPRAMLLACPIPRQFSLDLSNNDKQTGDDEDRANSISASDYAKLMSEISQKIDGRQDLSGNEKTPLILAELARLTGGQTLAANLILLRNNARIGAHLAFEYAKLCDKRRRIGELDAVPKITQRQLEPGKKRLDFSSPGRQIWTQSGNGCCQGG